MDNKQKVNPLKYPVFCLNGKSYAFTRWLDNTRAGLTALKNTKDNEFNYSLNQEGA
jgi:hypothetical protein